MLHIVEKIKQVAVDADQIHFFFIKLQELSYQEFISRNDKQVTRGHNIVADGWAGAANPQPYPTPIPNTPPTHSMTIE